MVVRKTYVLLWFCISSLVLSSSWVTKANAQGIQIKETKSDPSNKIGELHIVVDTISHRLEVRRNGHKFRSFPIAVGKDESPSPLGDWIVTAKSQDWGSGFGTRWLGLNVPWGMYGIHGTNKPYSIGREASSGCIRMFNRDVESLFRMIPIGTKVSITGYILGNPYELPRRLVEGERGPDVLLVQQRLSYAGYYHGVCDGIYGRSLESALRKFQMEHNINPDQNVSLEDYQVLGFEE